MLAAARIDRTRRAALAARARGHVAQPMPAQAPPSAVERAYVARLRSIAGRAINEAYAPVLRELPSLIERARSERGDAADWRCDAAGSGRAASASVAAAAKVASKGLSGPQTRSAAVIAGGDAQAHVQAQLGKQVRAVLGIDLAADEKAKARTAAFVHENTKLISGIGPGLAADIERIILSGLTAGQLHETLALAIKSRMQVAINRAELIAVDQVGKIVGQTNAARSQDLGATHFFWRTAEDERVRGNPSGKYPKAVPSHYARNGKRYAYADLPLGRNGERELPGVPIRCRCYAEPDLSAVLGEEPAQIAAATPSVDDLEAEAARLAAEVEAMLARPAPAPAPQPAPAPTPSVADVRAATAAIDAEAQRPMATAPPPGVTYSQQAIDGRDAFEAGLRIDLGKPVTLDEIAHAYAPPPGLTAHIDRAIAGGVDITYRNAAGEVVATMSREFRAGGVAYHASLEVGEKFRGSGIANAINGAALLRYKKMGITSIELDAAWIGRYAWASAGFSIAKESEAQVLAAAQRFIDENVPADKREGYRAKVAALLKDPSNLARWDDGDRYSVVVDTGEDKERGDYPIGKAILLHYKMPTWSGAMRLDESDPGYRRALQVYGVADRAKRAAPPAISPPAPPVPAPASRPPRRRQPPATASTAERRPTPAERRAALEASQQARRERVAAMRAAGAPAQSDEPVPAAHDGSNATSRALVVKLTAQGKLDDARAELDAQMRRAGMHYTGTNHGTRSNAIVVTDELSNARGSWSHNDGTIKLLPRTAADAARFAKQLADGTWDGSTVGLPSQFGALWEANRPHREAVEGMRTLVHETLHGHGPATGPGYYKGAGVLVEEMVTEFAARDWIMDQGGVSSASFDRGGQLGGYRGWCIKMIDAATESDPSLSRADAAAAVAQAALAYKALPRGSVTTPDHAVEAFAKLLPGGAGAWQTRLREISRTGPHDE